jgi:hypothetical protein
MNNAILLTAIIAAAGIVYDTIEFYQARHEVLNDFYNWRVVRSRYYILINRPVMSFVFDFLFARKTFMTIVIAHGVAAVLFPIVFLYSLPAAAVLAAIVFTVHCLTNIRTLVGRDGADQMQNIVWAGLIAYCLPLNENVKLVATGFIAAQLILSYLTSGIAKLISPVWRNGDAMHFITRMVTYCPATFTQIFRTRILSVSLCWMIIFFELLSPLLLFFGTPGAIAFIALGTLFHVGIAVTMGLTTFVFAFIATYPILYEFADRFWLH